MLDTDMVVGTGLRITVSKDELVSGLGVVSRAVSTRTSVPMGAAQLVSRPGVGMKSSDGLSALTRTSTA